MRELLRPSQRTQPASSGSGAQKYKDAYRSAFDFHMRNAPPTVDLEYWHTHKPGIDEPPPQEIEYWKKTANDLIKTAGNDSFLQDLLSVIYHELETEYTAIRTALSNESKKLNY